MSSELCSPSLKHSVMSSLNDSDPIPSILQMLTLKVVELSLRLERLAQSKNDQCRDQKWENKFFELSKSVILKEKAANKSVYHKPLIPLFKYLKTRKSIAVSGTGTEEDSQMTFRG